MTQVLRADLHIHTTASDGRWTPEQVVAGCRAASIGLLAVADHDATANVVATETLALEAGLAFLRAVEISTMNQGVMLHVLGYAIDPHHPPLAHLLEDNRTKLEATDDEDIRRLIRLGYSIDYEDYLAYTYDRTRGGFKSLNYLIDRGLCADPADFFQNIRSQLNHPWPDFAPPEEAVSAIRDAGGIPVLAHPGVTFEKQGGVRAALLDPLLDVGIAGLECYSQYHDEVTTAFCLDWCARHDLIVTGGSDYHGGFVGRQLGVPEVDTSQLRLGKLEQHIRRPAS